MIEESIPIKLPISLYHSYEAEDPTSGGCYKDELHGISI